MTAVKAECAAHIAQAKEGEGRGKDKVTEGSDKRDDEGQDRTRREGTVEHNSAPDPTWMLEDSEAEKSRNKDDRATNTIVSKQPVVKEEDTSGQLPFVQAIMDVNISEHFVPP